MSSLKNSRHHGVISAGADGPLSASSGARRAPFDDHGSADVRGALTVPPGRVRCPRRAVSGPAHDDRRLGQRVGRRHGSEVADRAGHRGVLGWVSRRGSTTASARAPTGVLATVFSHVVECGGVERSVVGGRVGGRKAALSRTVSNKERPKDQSGESSMTETSWTCVSDTGTGTRRPGRVAGRGRRAGAGERKGVQQPDRRGEQLHVHFRTPPRGRGSGIGPMGRDVGGGRARRRLGARARVSSAEHPGGSSPK